MKFSVKYDLTENISKFKVKKFVRASVKEKLKLEINVPFKDMNLSAVLGML
jgi:hypothetical protein